IKILPGHSRTQLDTITEIEVYGPVGGIEQMGKKSFVADAKATHMFMGNAKHVPTNLPGDLTGPLKKVNLPSMPTIPGASALHSGMTIVKGIATFPQADGLLHYRPVTVKANLLKKQRENAAIVKARLNKTKAPVAFKGWKGSTVTPITTPTRYANRLLVGSADYKMHAIGDNGAHLWGFKTDGRVYSAPTPHEAEVYFGSDDGYLYKVDIDSGILIWQFKTNGRIRSAPVVADKKVYVASWDGNVYAVDLTMGDLRWKAPIASTTSTSLAYSKGKLYIGDEDGNLHCLNAANGKPAWKPVNIKGERFSQCAVVCPDGVYFQGDYGTGVFLNLNTGAEKWPKKDVLKPLSKPLETPARVTGQVFATKTQLIIPHTRGLLVLKRATGIPDAAYKAPAVFKHVLSAAIYDNHLCVTESITHAQVNPEKRFVISHGTKMTVWQK
ncbi:MAG: PQQ-binding-like beta-propeller repeat protein, partial [Lentisphaeria bacterium]|nr:PQQ-binding-like beta-propeller repeat protein [Lentisphaeria bacterium]